MEIKEIIGKLEKTKEFKDYKKENNFSFLAHIFEMDDEANKGDFQIGFYNKDDTITTFVLSKASCQVIPQSKIFKKPDAEVKKLDLDKVKIGIKKAAETAEKILKEKYENETSTKRILILQDLDIGQVYNITFVTSSLKMLNIKIDAETGKVKEEKLSSLMDLKAS